MQCVLSHPMGHFPWNSHRIPIPMNRPVYCRPDEKFWERNGQKIFRHGRPKFIFLLCCILDEETHRIANFATTLVECYVIYMTQGCADSANRVQKEMVGLMRVKMMEKSEQVCKYAEILRRKKQFFKAILYFQIAQTISDRNIKNPLRDF